MVRLVILAPTPQVEPEEEDGIVSAARRTPCEVLTGFWCTYKRVKACMDR
jgi:hypothetical protein